MTITLPQRFGTAPIGSLLKRPKMSKAAQPYRSAREKDESYLGLIRQLPCLRCGLDPCGIAAHVRMPSAAHGKPAAGKGVKPDDRWSLPVCEERECHPVQHQQGELGFWAELGMAPLLICEELHAAAPDLVKMRAIVIRHVSERKS